MKNEHHAIVIGINHYPVSGLSALKGPVNDAEDFSAWLRDPQGGNVPQAHIHSILSSDFAQDAALPFPNQVETLFEPFITKGVQGRCGERLYIFVAGHGFGDPGDMGTTALYAANAQKMFPWHVAITDYVDWLRRHAVFDEIVLLMDCCRTVNSYHEVKEPQYPTTKERTGADQVRFFFAFAVGRGRVARERRFEDGRDSGIFTRTLLYALQTARSQQGKVTGQQLKDQIHNSIAAFAGEARIEPPVIRLDSYRDITFLYRKSAQAVPVRVVLEPYGGAETLVLSDGNFQKIREEKANSSTLTLELEPGLYKIAVKNTDRQQIFEVPNHAGIIV
ncbi:MAG: caspase family protein [Candidatus Electrothrix sp. GW3-4]|uniref:caspase family protein n=1 Tax=Candidatus Electrothrix sp. GW3-4 TaxID=3126740 RepID=UPI0030CA7340